MMANKTVILTVVNVAESIHVSLLQVALMCQTRNGYLHNEGKAAFLVQRGRSAIYQR